MSEPVHTTLMSDSPDDDSSSREQESAWGQRGPRVGGGRTAKVIGIGGPEAETREPRPKALPVDIWRIIDKIHHRALWIALAALICGAAGVAAGLWATEYSVIVQLIRKENSNAFVAGENFQQYELSTETVMGMMQSPEALERISARTNPRIPAPEIAEALHIFPDRNADFINLSVSGKTGGAKLASLANIAAEEVVQYTKQMQMERSSEMEMYLSQKLAAINLDLKGVRDEVARLSQESQVLDFEKEVEAYLTQLGSIDLKYESARIEHDTIDIKVRNLQQELARQAPGNDRLQAAREELAALLTRFTDAHPAVQAQKARIESLSQPGATTISTNAFDLRPGTGTLANTLYLQILDLNTQKLTLKRQMDEYEALREKMRGKIKGLSSSVAEYAGIKARRQQLEITQGLYESKHREARLLKENAMGYFRVFAPASPRDVSAKRRWMVTTGLAVAGALAGMLLAIGLVAAGELIDTRVRTAGDLERVTGLPVLATLGPLQTIKPADQVQWAFKTLTRLHGKLAATPDESLVCGFISARAGEGRSTWINLLVSAAGQRGLKVLTVATRPATEEPPKPSESTLLPSGPVTTLSTNVLAFPAQVAEQFNSPQTQAVVHIPLPGWVWNLERRKQWQSALAQWRNIPNLVLLVELPPACQPESVLLAENLPQVIWLANSGTPTSEETAGYLETLRHAGCNLVGAVLNREPKPIWKRRLAGWFGRYTAALGFGALLLASDALAQNPEVTPAPARDQEVEQAAGTFSVSPSRKRAPWQERLTLGPGDAVDISLYGQPEFSRTNIVVRPDGRLSYLQAQDLPATGLTIDELRGKLDQELGRLGYRSPRTMVIPVSFQSKKYYVLGKVANRGVFPLDRPVTVLEAIARARGLETGLVGENTFELADLKHSFLVRNGRRTPLDFEKLFHGGDLSQNIAIEPGDYLYFPGTSLSEVFILGEVTSPGPLSVGSSGSLAGALSARGGFTERAYKSKVLVVRGSLSQPETFVVDVGDVLAARAPDFKLEPKDIVYVSARPWIKAEELLDAAVQAFIQGAVTGVVSDRVGAIITSPVFD